MTENSRVEVTEETGCVKEARTLTPELTEREQWSLADNTHAIMQLSHRLEAV